MTRRWQPHWRKTVAGLPLRVVPGYKAPDDLRLEWLTPDGWRPVTMAAGAILADFWYENEEVLYPPPAAGGHYYLSYVNQAAHEGWEVADARLLAERQAKQERAVTPSTTGNASDLDTDEFNSAWRAAERRKTA
jgi:hypothetical protein